MSFSTDLESFANKTGIAADSIFLKLVVDGFGLVTKLSPVDEGRFRGNWRLAINRVDLRTTQRAPTRSRGTKFGDAPRPAELAIALSQLASIKAGATAHITNNLPYAKPLNDGSSSQNRTGIIGPAKDKLISDFSNAVRTSRASGGLL